MGCFNSVMIECPHCQTMHEHQSKSGDCTLGEFTIHTADIQDLADAAGESHVCYECGGTFHLHISRIATVVGGPSPTVSEWQ